jgi:hypothetical protein
LPDAVFGSSFSNTKRLGILKRSPGGERRGVGFGAGFEDHVGVSRLAPTLVGHSDHRDLPDRRVLGEARLHLRWVDVLPARDEHLLRASGQCDEAFLVLRAEVARSQPALPQGLCVGVGSLPVAEHYDRTARDDLPGLARCDVAPVGDRPRDAPLGDDAKRGVSYWPADAPRLALRVLA